MSNLTVNLPGLNSKPKDLLRHFYLFRKYTHGCRFIENAQKSLKNHVADCSTAFFAVLKIFF